jgi:hypothetical protein
MRKNEAYFACVTSIRNTWDEGLVNEDNEVHA